MAEKAKYIDVKELSIILDVMRNPDSEFVTDDYIDGFSDGISAAIKELEAFPAADVVPVRHGRWVGYETKSYKNSENGIAKKYYRCSSCRCFNAIRSNYCPKCGAKMDGDEQGNDT